MGSTDPRNITPKIPTPPMITRIRSTGIDPGKYTLHVAHAEWNVPPGNPCNITRVPDAVTFETIDWTTHDGWRAGAALFLRRYHAEGLGVVSSETQWIDRHVFDRWAGIESVVHTRGAMRGMAASHGIREHVAPTKGIDVGLSFASGEYVVFDVTMWRSIALSPRTFNVRNSARTTEQVLANKLLALMRMQYHANSDHSAALGIALARFGLNYHTWLPL